MDLRRMLRVAAAISLVGCPVIAESPPPFPEFSAKRVKPPVAGQPRPKIVQIDPEAPVVVPKVKPSTEVALPSGAYGWFWDGVSPELSASGPGRLEPALQQLSNPPVGRGIAAPRLSDLQTIVSAFGGDILMSTIGTKVSPALVLAVIAIESGGRLDAVSSAGAQGLMQLMPDTADRFGAEESFDASQNIGAGVKFLDFLMKKFDDDPILVLAGYNAGENSIGAHDGVPPYAETRDYVPKVLAAYAVARAMCLTPPELITDGCVFAMK